MPNSAPKAKRVDAHGTPRSVFTFVTRRDAVPVEAVRDLLGIARAMYAAAKREGAGAARLSALSEVGKRLKLALDCARRTPPDSVGHRAAWSHAEAATGALMKTIPATTPAAPIVEAAVIRLRRLEPRPSEREARKAAEQTRR